MRPTLAVLVASVLGVPASACREPPRARAVDAELVHPIPTPAPALRCPDREALDSQGVVAPKGAWLDRLSTAQIYVRLPPDKLVVASPADHAVLRSYLSSPVRGKRVGDRQTTLLTAARPYAVGEEVRVIHVLEVFAKGEELFVMGPKPVTGEWVDGKLATPKVPEWGPFTMGVYDGAVLQSPGVDINFEITTYRFDTPGLHHVQWRAGPVPSNTLCIEVR